MGGRSIQLGKCAAALGAAALSCACALAQYPTAKATGKKTTSPRAVGVLEWVGDPGKPSASRLIPVSIFIDGSLQDGGLYMARPEPMTLEGGTVYELQTAGKPMGLFEVGSAGHLQTAQFPNSWFGYGSFRPLAKPKPPSPVQLARSSNAHVTQEADAERPTFGRKASQSGGAQPNPNSQPGNPAPSSAPPGGAAPTASAPAASAPAEGAPPSPPKSSGPDTIDSNGNVTQPGANSKSGKSSKPSASPTAAPAGSAPTEDPDRPTLKRRSAGEADNGSSGAGAAASEYKPAPDPNRPVLHRGVRPGDEASGTTPAQIDSKLAGTPLHLQQAVAVSDATVREPHSFAYSWSDSQQQATLRQQMEALAQKALAAPPSKAAAPLAAGHRAAATTSKSRQSAAAAKQAAASPALEDEKFSAYELSYEGGATLVLTAHTAGAGAALKYVAIAAVVDIYGQPQVVFQSVSDAAHLDQTPWVGLVDVVDADDSNRADLLFELHGAGQRQFALYRVARAVAQQVLVTDPIP